MRHWPAAALLLTACAAPRVAPPPALPTVPPAWRDGSAAGPNLSAGWPASFGDPTLVALVARAVAANPDIGIAEARLRGARAELGAARAALLPTLGGGVGGGPSRTVSAFGTGIDGTGIQPQLQASWEIDVFGRLAAERRAAAANVAAQARARDAAALAVSAAAAGAYLALVTLDARRATVVATIAARAEALRLARSRATAGYTSELELRQAEAEYEAAAQLLPQTDLAITRAENALSVVLGTAPGPQPRGQLVALRLPPVPAGLPSDLLRRRPDIAAAEATIAAGDARLAAARARFLPQLTLTGSAGIAISTLLADPIGIWSLGGSVLAPLFQGGRLRAGVAGAAAQRDVAVSSYGRTVLTALREVEDALAAARRLDEQAAILARQRVAVAEALRHAGNRYRAGYASYLEQLDAQRNLLAVDLSLAQISGDRLANRVTLIQALGGGIVADGKTAPAG